MFSCFGNVEEKKPWKGVASTFKKKLRNVKKSKESYPTTYSNQVSFSRNLEMNRQRLEHFRQYCEHYHDLHHHHPGSHIGAKAHSGSKYDHVRSGLINMYEGHRFDLSEEVDIRAEEFIRNMKMSWSLEKQQSTDSISSISSQ